MFTAFIDNPLINIAVVYARGCLSIQVALEFRRLKFHAYVIRSTRDGVLSASRKILSLLALCSFFVARPLLPGKPQLTVCSSIMKDSHPHLRFQTNVTHVGVTKILATAFLSLLDCHIVSPKLGLFQLFASRDVNEVRSS